MSAGRTFYEVLGVKRSATAQDIEQAYAHLRAQMEDASQAPDARRAAVAKAAYTTLSDPASRAEYDESLGLNRPKRVKKRNVVPWAIGGVVALIVLGALGWRWHSNRLAAAAPEDGVDVPRLVRDVGRRVARLEAAFVSGEVRSLGMAVETGEGEMTAACGSVPAGTELTVHDGSTSVHADISAMKGNGLCMLAVKGVRDGVKVRATLPPEGETLQAIVRTSEGVAARELTVERTLTTAQGTVLVFKTGAALPPGTPIFDTREQLVGAVASIQPAGSGGVYAVPVKEPPPAEPKR